MPHAVGEVSIPALVEEATVKAWVARWTDWATDVLFGGKTEGDSRITMVKARYSRIQVDVERLEGEMDRIAAFTLPDKGGVAFELSDGLRNAYLSEWFRYRAVLLQAAAQGDNPLIIDCHSFPIVESVCPPSQNKGVSFFQSFHECLFNFADCLSVVFNQNP